MGQLNDTPVKAWVRSMRAVGARIHLGHYFFPVMTPAHLLKLCADQLGRAVRDTDLGDMGRSLSEMGYKQIKPQARDRIRTVRL